MPSDASLPPLSELLKKSREIRRRLNAHSVHAVELKKRVEDAKTRVTRHSRFYPE